VEDPSSSSSFSLSTCSSFPSRLLCVCVLHISLLHLSPLSSDRTTHTHTDYFLFFLFLVSSTEHIVYQFKFPFPSAKDVTQTEKE